MAGPAFAGNCPLWTYILAEAMRNHQQPDPTIPVTEAVTVSTPQLGPVGGRIVAEVFLGLMFADPSSYLHGDPGLDAQPRARTAGWKLTWSGRPWAH